MTFRQRALIPGWLIPAILALLALLLALYFLWPRKVDMPAVRGLTTSGAMQVLEAMWGTRAATVLVVVVAIHLTRREPTLGG